MVILVFISFTGFKSNGMVLCAVHNLEDGSEKVEFVDPPSEAAVGDRISGEGLTGTPLTASQVRTQCYFL
jgi:aminoacyl tRNA synthase complex-interacting multifunctional protein 1